MILYVNRVSLTNSKLGVLKWINLTDMGWLTTGWAKKEST